MGLQYVVWKKDGKLVTKYKEDFVEKSFQVQQAQQTEQ